MLLKHAIDASAKWLNECNALANGAKLDNTTRNRVSATLLHLSLEHHGAIQILVSNEPNPHYGSAFALLRLQFESYIRGIWFQRCASEYDITKFIEYDQLPKIDKLIENLETCPDFKEGDLKSFKQKIWKIMCGYTHGGSVQVASRMNATEIACNYTEEQVCGLISLACTITLNVSVAFANLLSNDKMAGDILSGYKVLFPNDV